jgi:hypothetical protein
MEEIDGTLMTISSFGVMAADEPVMVLNLSWGNEYHESFGFELSSVTRGKCRNDIERTPPADLPKSPSRPAPHQQPTCWCLKNTPPLFAILAE